MCMVAMDREAGGRGFMFVLPSCDCSQVNAMAFAPLLIHRLHADKLCRKRSQQGLTPHILMRDEYNLNKPY